jgi:hypothetical protein
MPTGWLYALIGKERSISVPRAADLLVLRSLPRPNPELLEGLKKNPELLDCSVVGCTTALTELNNHVQQEKGTGRRSLTIHGTNLLLPVTSHPTSEKNRRKITMQGDRKITQHPSRSGWMRRNENYSYTVAKSI